MKNFIMVAFLLISATFVSTNVNAQNLKKKRQNPVRITDEGLKVGKCFAVSNDLYKCFGWVYEKSGLNYSPLKDVSVDIVFMAECLSGSCNPQPFVKTDSTGYFEINTSFILDTLRIHSPKGYYGVCNGSVPTSGGGTYIRVGEAFSDAFKQERITATSCNPAQTNPDPGQLDAEGREYPAGISNENLNLGQCYIANSVKGKYKCYGWIYEQSGAAFIPHQGAGVDIIWFAGCMFGGSCNPMSATVLSDSKGYFEVYTNTLLDTLRIQSKAGYYGVCNGRQPMSGGGTGVSNYLNRPFRIAFKQYVLTADSCK